MENDDDDDDTWQRQRQKGKASDADTADTLCAAPQPSEKKTDGVTTHGGVKDKEKQQSDDTPWGDGTGDGRGHEWAEDCAVYHMTIPVSQLYGGPRLLAPIREMTKPVLGVDTSDGVRAAPGHPPRFPTTCDSWLADSLAFDTKARRRRTDIEDIFVNQEDMHCVAKVGVTSFGRGAENGFALLFAIAFTAARSAQMDDMGRMMHEGLLVDDLVASREYRVRLERCVARVLTEVLGATAKHATHMIREGRQGRELLLPTKARWADDGRRESLLAARLAVWNKLCPYGDPSRGYVRELFRPEVKLRTGVGSMVNVYCGAVLLADYRLCESYRRRRGLFFRPEDFQRFAGERRSWPRVDVYLQIDFLFAAAFCAFCDAVEPERVNIYKRDTEGLAAAAGRELASPFRCLLRADERLRERCPLVDCVSLRILEPRVCRVACRVTMCVCPGTEALLVDGDAYTLSAAVGVRETYSALVSERLGASDVPGQRAASMLSVSVLRVPSLQHMVPGNGLRPVAAEHSDPQNCIGEQGGGEGDGEDTRRDTQCGEEEEEEEDGRCDDVADRELYKLFWHRVPHEDYLRDSNHGNGRGGYEDVLRMNDELVTAEERASNMQRYKKLH